MKPSIETISIIGAGALGGAYASIFHDMDNRCVSFIASGDRFERLVREGLIVNGRIYHIPVFQPEDLLPPADLIIVAVKHNQLNDAIREMKNRVGCETTIISIMNGIESETEIGAAYGMEKVLYAVSVGIDGVREGNQVNFKKRGKIFFGEAKNFIISDRVKRVQALFDRAGIPYETPPDMIRVLWWKFMINVGINQASAVLRAPYSVFQTSQEARDLMESAMQEVIILAEKEKIPLSKEDIKNWESVLSGLNPEGKTSMLQDVEANRKTEVGMFAGKVIELGMRHHIPTPVNQRLFDIIRAMEGNARCGSFLPVRAQNKDRRNLTLSDAD
ncbi:MAG: 2-dehydropantoate 2-reductase [Deltaproteobacteria bacterium]|nr:2-dehydropantoate 2-reductase [Deltaproteobacteria bacterium]